MFDSEDNAPVIVRGEGYICVVGFKDRKCYAFVKEVKYDGYYLGSKMYLKKGESKNSGVEMFIIVCEGEDSLIRKYTLNKEFVEALKFKE